MGFAFFVVGVFKVFNFLSFRGWVGVGGGGGGENRGFLSFSFLFRFSFDHVREMGKNY